MAEKPKRNQATSPSRNKRGGGASPKKPTSSKGSSSKSEKPGPIVRRGAARFQGRPLDTEESKARQDRRERDRAEEVKTQAAERKALRKSKDARGQRQDRGRNATTRKR